MAPPAPPRPAPRPERPSAPLEQERVEVPLPSVAAGAVIADKYRLDRPLRQGAMGSVWIATHLALETQVAIKFMVPSTEAPAGEASRASEHVATRTRFEREARAAAQIRSANVVQILDYGVDRQLQYIVMELLEGEDFEHRLRRLGALPLGDVARIIVSVARALQLAHSKGVVHRDLKPGNIFLAREGEVDEVPKILDFGVAKAIKGDRPTGEATVDGTVVGTPSYMSPEQAMGRADIDHRSDLWSLGIIAFRATTGVKPFAADSLLETIVQICSATPPRPSEINPELPRAVDSFFERALERDVDKRFQSAKEFATAFVELASRTGSLPPPARAALDLELERDAEIDIPISESLVPRSIEIEPRTHWARRPIVWALAVGVSVFVVGALLARRRGESQNVDLATRTIAPSTRPSMTSPPPLASAVGDDRATLDAASAMASPQPSAATPQSTRTRPAPRPTPAPLGPAATSSSKKPKHDLGY